MPDNYYSKFYCYLMKLIALSAGILLLCDLTESTRILTNNRNNNGDTPSSTRYFSVSGNPDSNL
jgi:hypothetical protein